MSGRWYRSDYNEFRGRQRDDWNRRVESDQPTTSSGEGRYGGRFHSRGRGRGRGWGRGGGGGGGFGPPPGLTGKEIGLWYRQRSIQKNKETKTTSLAVNLDPRIQRHIQDVLYSIDTPYLCPSGQRSDVTRGFRPHQESRKFFVEKEDNFDDEDVIELMECSSKKQEKHKGGGGLDGGGEPAASKYRHIAESKFKHKFLQNITGSIESNLANSLSMSVMLDRDVGLDDSFKAELLSRENSKQYKKMLAFRKKLPAFEKKNELIKLISENQTILISGETGCGKTTQVAQFILDDFIMKGDGSVCHVVCTQPRRISAISVAERVAQERDESCGRASVGYHIRLEAKLPRRRGSILYCTTGMLLQFMRSDPGLRTVSHLILDEIHERDVISDFVITILKDVLPKRPDLKLILMSATLNAEHFSEYYNNCPSINIPGFTYPVTQYYLEDVLELTNFRSFKPMEDQEPKGWRKHLRHSKVKMREIDEYKSFIEPYVRHLRSQGKYSAHVLMSLCNPESEQVNVDLIEALIHHICRNEGDGAILVFLPGWTDISKLHSLLSECNRYNSDYYVIIPLHSLMPTTTQKSVFDRPPPGVRKIVLATNIAETSITIDDVVFVVDCGKIKMKNFDAENNIATLKSEWVSLANSKQRKGRAGRVQPGICYHLYSKAREMLLASYPLPEMLRTRLEEVILQMKILQLGQVKSFLKRVMNPPESNVIELSLKLLRTLNALDENEKLTPLGYHLANLPLDPQIGKMILMGAIFSCIDPVYSIAASLSFKDPFFVPLGAEQRVNARKIQLSNGIVSDHLIVAEAMKRWEAADRIGNGRSFCWDYFLSSNTMGMLRNMKQQFAQYMHEMNFLTSSNVKDRDGNLNSDNIGLVKAIICSGLYPNVAVIRKMKRNRRTGKMRMVLHTPEDGTVELHPKCVADKISECESPFLLYHLKLKSTAVFLHDASVVNPLPLLFFAESLRTYIDEDNEIISINSAIHFRCPKSTAMLVKDVRERLNGLLEHKITHPGVIKWRTRCDEGNLLRAIIELITYEDEKMWLMAEDGDNEFSD